MRLDLGGVNMEFALILPEAGRFVIRYHDVFMPLDGRELRA